MELDKRNIEEYINRFLEGETTNAEEQAIYRFFQPPVPFPISSLRQPPPDRLAATYPVLPAYLPHTRQTSEHIPSDEKVHPLYGRDRKRYRWLEKKAFISVFR